jgi:hypothetical protein
MVKLRLLRFVGAVQLGLLLAAAGPAWAQLVSTSRPNPADPLRAPSTDVLDTSSGFGRRGNFVGTLVEESCQGTRPPGMTAQCDATGRYYALLFDGHESPNPLLVTSAPIFEQLRASGLIDTRVRVGGVFYSSTGEILVSDLQDVSDESPRVATRRASGPERSATDSSSVKSASPPTDSTGINVLSGRR